MADQTSSMPQLHEDLHRLAEGRSAICVQTNGPRSDSCDKVKAIQIENCNFAYS